MTKYDLELEQEARQADFSVDKLIEKLVQKQQEEEFGFSEYWQDGYTLEHFREKYQDDFMNRTPPEDLKKLKDFVKKERERQGGHRMVGEKNIRSGSIPLIACKILWRAFRRIGFKGTKLKGDRNAVNEGCLICIRNIPDVQKGMRITGPDDSTNHVVLMNPFPILKDQVTIASLRHEPQKLTERHIEFILHLTEISKKFKYSFNGIGAGASIPNHFHFYGFTGSLPIEKVKVAAAVIKLDNLVVHELDADWPVITLVAIGDKGKIASYLHDFTSHLGQRDIGVNILFARDEYSKVKVYVVPRQKSKPEPQTGFNNEFGVIEMSGMLVCESSEAFASANADKAMEAIRQVGYPNTESGRARFHYDLLGPGCIPLYKSLNWR